VRFFGERIVADHLQGTVMKEDWDKAVSHNALFFDQDVRTDCLCLVEEGQTTRTEEFWDVDSRYADEFVFALHGNFVCGRDVG
jgi:hypothetical protein